LEALKASNSRLEERLNDEKEGKKAAEDRLDKLTSEKDSRVKEMEDSAEFKLRESQRRVKSDVEEDWKERTKTIERRMNLDIEELKNDSIIQKRKLEESTKLYDEMKRKVGLSKEDGRLEGLAENESLRSSVNDLEAQLKAESNEHRKHREDHMALAGRLASALQTTQIANAECEAAKAQVYLYIYIYDTYTNMIIYIYMYIYVYDVYIHIYIYISYIYI
jgi:hypothetical protein